MGPIPGGSVTTGVLRTSLELVFFVLGFAGSLSRVYLIVLACHRASSVTLGPPEHPGMASGQE